MDRLFRQRMEYIDEISSQQGCFLCAAAGARQGDAAGPGSAAELVVLHRPSCFVILNKYPYNTGHLLIATNRHVGDLTELDEGESQEVTDLTKLAVTALRQTMSPEGFNIGANLGVAAGAGVPGHFHMHVVPRWAGDTNFMPVLGEAKVLPEILSETLVRLREWFTRNA